MNLGHGDTPTLKDSGAEALGDGARGREAHIIKQ